MLNNRKFKTWRLLLAITLLLIISPASASAKEYRTVIDCIGRKVQLPSEINGIAAVDSFAAEVILMLGAGDYLKACPNGVKGNVLLQRLYPDLKEVPAFHASGGINTEAVMELGADVLFIKHDFLSKETQARKFETLNIPFIVIEYEDTASQMAALELIGEIIGGDAKNKADFITDYYQNIATQVQNRTAMIPESAKKRVYHAVNAFNFTSGRNLGSNWISDAGGLNVAHMTDNLIYDHSINLEYLFIWQPDVIICNEAQTAAKFKSDDRLKNLKAVEQECVLNVPVGITRWGHPVSLEKFFAMLWLGSNLYPEYYADIDLKTEVVNFYSALGLEIDDELYASIIRGEGLRPPRKNN